MPLASLSQASWMAFPPLFGFHANLPTLNSTGPRPGRRTFTVSPSGSGLSPFQDNAATISTIAKPGAMLNRGQKRAKENAALSAEPCCAAECTLERPRNKRMHCCELRCHRGVEPASGLTNSLRKFQIHITTPEGWPLLNQ